MNNLFIHKWTAQVKKGVLSFIVLNLLKESTYYGYELIEKVKISTDMDIAEGTLYPLLIKLNKENLVTSKWVEQKYGIPRKYYSLSEEGKITLQKMKEYWLLMSDSIQKIS